MKPLISVIMNCFNGEKYLNEAIDSVINQNYENWELIFWDNKSFDRSAEIVSSYRDKRIKYFFTDTFSSVGIARSKAFEKTNGELIGFLDVDDIWMKNKLEEIVKSFIKNKDAGIFYSNTLFFNEKDNMPLYSSKQISGSITSKLLTNYFLSLESVVVSRAKIDLLKIKFDNRFNFISDFDLFTRLSAISKAVYVSKILSGWRVHNDSESFKKVFLFHQEKLLWYSINKNNKLFQNFKNELDEFKLITNAEQKFFNKNPFLITRIDKLFSHKFSNLKNFMKYCLASIPFGKYLYKLKKLRKLKKL